MSKPMKLLLGNKFIGPRPTSYIYHNQIRNFYEKYKHGPTELSNPKPDYWQWVKEFVTGDGLRYIKEEWQRTKKKPFRRIYRKPVKLFETRVFEHFDSDEAISKWKVWADSDALSGFSNCLLTRSPAGHAHFKGLLNTKVPDDGITHQTGFVCLIGPRRPREKLVQSETKWNWENFNTFEMRVRGDGRKYNLVLHTGDRNEDIKFYDMHGLPFYTRGGPQWQTIRIPFSKFIFAYKGLVQDEQGMLPYADIRFIAITLNDKITGPFSLEIDYMGLRKDFLPFNELNAYEHYSFPHIKYRPIQVSTVSPE